MELTNQYIVDRLKAEFGAAILSTEEPYNMLTITFERDKVLDILRFLYNDAEMGFTFLTDITGIHYPDPNDE